MASQLRALPLHVALDVYTEMQGISLSARRRQMFSNLSSALDYHVPATSTQNQQTCIPATTRSTQNILISNYPTPSNNTQTEQIQCAQAEEECRSSLFDAQQSPSVAQSQTFDMLEKPWNMS